MCGVTLMQRLESTKGRKRMNQVSIIIPVHNTPEEYLRECLHSVLRLSLIHISEPTRPY